jgi:hypothetical protein
MLREMQNDLVEVNTIRILSKQGNQLYVAVRSFPDALDPLMEGLVLTNSIIVVPAFSDAVDIELPSCWARTGRLKESGVAICSHCVYSVNADGSSPVLLACLDSMICETNLLWEKQKYVLLLQLEANGDVVLGSF